MESCTRENTSDETRVNDSTSSEPNTVSSIDQHAEMSQIGIPHSPRKVYKSSVVLIPTDDIWPQIQVIREKHDRGYVRWMPHINMMYPFIEDTDVNFKDAAESFKKGLASIKPFKILFSKDSFGYFRHKKDSVLWLKPLEEIPKQTENVESNDVQLEKNSTSGIEKVAKNVSIDEQSNDAAVNNKMSDSRTESYPNPELENFAAGLFDDENGSDVNNKGADNVNKKRDKLKKKEKREKRKSEKKSSKNTVVCSPYRFHPGVLSLQTQLEQVFPKCNDVSNISDNGFFPHMSVGQFQHADVDEFMEKFKTGWADCVFEVKEICLISRADFDDPFHVRYRVSLSS